MRLGFAVAIHVDPDVLLVDEVLAVGDEGFTHKCLDKFAEFQRRGKTILLVTHSLGLVERFCDEALWLDAGRMTRRRSEARRRRLHHRRRAQRRSAAGRPSARGRPRTCAPRRSTRRARRDGLAIRRDGRPATCSGPPRAAGARARSRSPTSRSSARTATPATSSTRRDADDRLQLTRARRCRSTTSSSASASSTPTASAATAPTPTSRSSSRRDQRETARSVRHRQLDLSKAPTSSTSRCTSATAIPTTTTGCSTRSASSRARRTSASTGRRTAGSSRTASSSRTDEPASVFARAGAVDRRGVERRRGAAPAAASSSRTACSTSCTPATSATCRRRAEGDVLIVGVNSDRSVRPTRARAADQSRERERAEVLAALAGGRRRGRSSTTTRRRHHRAALQPDVLVKGADWAPTRSSAATRSRPRRRVVRDSTRRGYSTSLIESWPRIAATARGPPVSPKPRLPARHRRSGPHRSCNKLLSRCLGRRNELVHARHRPHAPRAAQDRCATRSAPDRNAGGLTRPTSRAHAPRPGAGAAAAAAVAAVVLLVVPTDPDVEPLVDDAVLPFDARRAGDADAERVVLPFPSHEVDPYRGLAPHFDVRVRARARCSRAARRRGARRRGVGRGACCRGQPTGRLRDAASCCSPDVESTRDARRSAGRRGLHPRGSGRRARRILASAAAARRRLPAGEAQPVRVEFIGDTIESLRRYDPADAAVDRDDRPRASCRCARSCRPRSAGRCRRCHSVVSTTAAARFDYATESRRRVEHVDDVAEPRPRLLDSSSRWRPEQCRRRRGAGRERAPAPEAITVDWEDLAAGCDGDHGSNRLAARRRDGRPSPRRLQPAHGVPRPRPPLGRRAAQGARRRARPRCSSRTPRPRRAHDRAARATTTCCAPGRRARRTRMPPRCSSRRASVARLPSARRRRCSSTPRPTSSTRSGTRHEPPPAAIARDVPLRLPRPEGRRSRRPRRPRHRRVRRPEADLGVGGRRPGVHGAPLRRRRQAVRPGRAPRSRPEVHRRAQPGARSAGRHHLGKGQDARQEGHARHGRGAAEALRRAQGRARPRLRARHALAGGVRGRVRVRPDPRPGVAIADIKRDMESPTPMDRLLCGDVGYGKTEVAMRAAFKAVMDGKQVAFLAPTTVLAFQHLKTLKERFAGVPGPDRHGQPVPHEGRAEGDARGPGGRQARHHRRHAPPALEGRQFRDLGLLVVDEEQRFGVAHKERIKQMRKRGRRPDDDGDADSAHAEHVAGRHPRHVGHRDAAEGSPGDPDQRRQVRPEGDRARDPARAGARRPGLLRPQPRRVDLLDRQPAAAAGARSARSSSATAR